MEEEVGGRVDYRNEESDSFIFVSPLEGVHGWLCRWVEGRRHECIRRKGEQRHLFDRRVDNF